MKTPHLNRALQLEDPVRNGDGAGGYIRDWQVRGTLWAQVKAGTGRETAAFAATVSRVPYQITVRAAPFGAPSRPVAGQRFRDGERIFQINAVADAPDQPQYLVCYTLEETAT